MKKVMRECVSGAHANREGKHVPAHPRANVHADLGFVGGT